MEWQPIETAPRNGMPILGYKKWPAKGFYDCHTVFWGNDFGFCQLGGDEKNPRPWQPTHWMPLPDAPDGH